MSYDLLVGTYHTKYQIISGGCLLTTMIETGHESKIYTWNQWDNCGVMIADSLLVKFINCLSKNPDIAQQCKIMLKYKLSDTKPIPDFKSDPSRYYGRIYNYIEKEYVRFPDLETAVLVKLKI